MQTLVRHLDQEIEDIIGILYSKYIRIEEDEENLDKQLDEMSETVKQPLRKDELEINNRVVLNEVGNINLTIQDIKQAILDNNKILNERTQILRMKLQSFNKRRGNTLRRMGSNISSKTLYDIDQLNRTVVEKDSIILQKYEKIGEALQEIDVARRLMQNDETQNHPESPVDDNALVADQTESTNSTEIKESMNTTEIIEPMNTTEVVEPTNTTEIMEKEIKKLKKELDTKNLKFAEASKSRQALIQRCNDCKGVWDSFMGWAFQKTECEFS